MDPIEKKEALPKEYVHNISDGKSLIQKELDINRAEQKLLKERIQIMGQFVQDLPSSDPQYSFIWIQLKMDQIEIDELKNREAALIDKLATDYTDNGPRGGFQR